MEFDTVVELLLVSLWEFADRVGLPVGFAMFRAGGEALRLCRQRSSSVTFGERSRQFRDSFWGFSRRKTRFLGTMK